MIKLIIADDHIIFREGIAELLAQNESIDEIIQVSNGLEVIEILKQQSIDLILMDINMPELDGIEATAEIKAKSDTIKIIMLTMHDTHNIIQRLLKIGVDGYLLKTTSKLELFEAIRTVMAGESYFGKAVQDTFMKGFNSKKVVSEVKLTKREKEILELICEEFNTNEIAEKLFISTYTVETHRKNLLSKTGAKNVAGLVKFALQNKFV